MHKSFREFQGRRGGGGERKGLENYGIPEKFVTRETAEIPSSSWSAGSFDQERMELTGFNEPIDFYTLYTT